MLKAAVVFLLSIGISNAFIPSAFSPAFRTAHAIRNTHLNLESQRTRSRIHGHELSRIVMKDYPKPNVEDTANYREANRLSEKFSQLKGAASPKTVAIIGGMHIEIFSTQTTD